MHLVEFAFTKPPRSPAVTGDAFLRELWAAAGPADGVEHIRVHMARSGARGVAFVLAPDGASAITRCTAVCRRSLARSTALAGWTLARP